MVLVTCEKCGDIIYLNSVTSINVTEIGKVISRCLGHAEGAFIKAYTTNLAKQNEHALEASQVATAVIKLMEKRMSEGSAL